MDPRTWGFMSRHQQGIHGTNYLVHFTTDVPPREFGTCSDPRGTYPTVQINSRRRSEDLLYAILHEFRHASDWCSCEEEIVAYSAASASFIFRPEILKKLGLTRRHCGGDPNQ